MLGRLLDPDPRDQSYPMRALLKVAPKVTSKYWWANGAWLDQGNTSTCVGHGWAHWIEDGPKTWPGTIDPYAIYTEACKLDPWTGNDNGDLDFGTSVRAGAQALQARGLITEYRWAWDSATVIDTLLTKGPVVLGINWYTQMDVPDEKGIIRVGGVLAGGHCCELNGANTTKEVVRLKNSWGRGWANNGHGWLTFADLERLLSEDGEACIAVEA